MGCRWWFRALLRPWQVERELADELQFHVEEQVAENLAAGMSPTEARAAARRSMGGMAQVQEECRDARGTAWITDFARDLEYAFRTVRRSPGFAAVVVVTLGLGIGANTAIFSIADAVLLRMLPVREPERLFQVLRPDPTTGGYFDTFSFPTYQAMQLTAARFADLLAERYTVTLPVAVDGSGEESARRSEVSGNYFEVLGVRMALGSGMSRKFDSEPGRHPVAVLSYRYWRERFHEDPHVLGRTISANLREALAVVAAGAAVGAGAAYLAGRAVASLLFGLKPGDPVATLMATAVLAAAAMGAAALPAWQASRTDPVNALREE